MDSTSEEHIQELEKRLLSLNASIMDESDGNVCNRLQMELRAVESTLVVLSFDGRSEGPNRDQRGTGVNSKWRAAALAYLFR